MPAGRPTDYSPELADEICMKLALGSNMIKISQIESMPSMDTLYRWRRIYPEFSDKIALAVQERAEMRAEEVDTLKDDVATGKLEPNAAGVIFKALTWQAAKENPRKYGEKQQVEHSGSISLDKLVTDSMGKKE